MIGKAKAIELIATGRTFSFELAEEMGIVNEIYQGDAASFAEQILTYARQFCSPNKAPMAVGLVKRSIQTGAEIPLGDALALERELQSILFRSHDAHEGIAAFTEQRVARFENR